MAIEINLENINDLEASSSLLVIDFGATWCGPCKVVAPIVEELATEYEGKANIGKCDVEDNDDIATKYKVRNVPTLVFVKDGKLLDRHVGVITKADLSAKIEAYL